MTDFLITFTVDGTQAIRMMEEIGARATALEAQLNALGKGGTGRSATSGILAGLGLTPQAVAGAQSAISGLEASVARFRQTAAAAGQLGITLGAGQFKTAALNAQVLANQLGQTHPQYKALTAEAQAWNAESQRVAALTDSTTQSFERHTRRIFEAIIAYEAFGVALSALKGGTQLVVDLDRESRRLEAVLSISPEQGAQFIKGLGQIASDTVTPFEHLVAEADRMSSAFLNIDDPVRRAAASLEFARDAGNFTTVTQRDLGEETSNLIAIMKQLHIPIGQFGDFLGKIVVAGGNASTVITGLSDSLQIVSQSAHETNVNTDVLLASLSKFLISTGRTGSEVGNIFKTLFQRIANPQVVSKVSDITDGMLKLRDAAGNLRDPFQILLELNALLKEGAISATQFSDVLQAIAPPLNPAAKADFELIVHQLGTIGDEVNNIGKADLHNLTDLVNQINATIGPQFQKLIIDLQRAFVELFGPAILVGGQVLIELLRDLGAVLSVLPHELLTIIGVLGALTVAFKILALAGRGVVAVMGLQGLGAIFGGGTAAGGQLALGLSGTGRAATIAAGGMRLLGTALRTVIPLAIAFAAIEFGSKLIEDAQKIQALKDAGFGEPIAQEAVNGPTANAVRPAGGGLGARQGPFQLDPQLTSEQAENLNRLATALNEAQSAGTLTAESQKQMTDAILGTDGAVKTTLVSIDDIRGATVLLGGAIADTHKPWQQMLADAAAFGGAQGELFAAQAIGARSAKLVKGLIDEQAASYRDLNDSLRQGDITQRQWNDGQRQVAQAAKVAGDLVAAQGDHLRRLIPELGDAAEGNDALASAVYGLIIQAGDSIPHLQNLIDRLINLTAQDAVAAAETGHLAGNQAIATQTSRAYATGIANAAGVTGEYTSQTVAAITATTGLIQQMMNLGVAQSVALGTMNKINNTRLGQVVAGGFAGFVPTSTSTANVQRQIDAILRQIRSVLGSGSSVPFGTVPRPSGGTGGAGSTGTKKEPVRATTFDIEDLPRRLIPQMIEIARRLRNRIPGERRATRDELVSLIKDARFIQNVRGIDQSLLREALDRLTKQIERQNELEEAKARRDAILRNTVVNAGPLSALISGPTRFGVGGNLATETGLNFNPSRGNFVINVPVELKGLQPAALQQLIYQIIARAIRNAMRT